MTKGDSSHKVVARVSAMNVRIASTPKFKRHKVLVFWDFPPVCGRVTAPNLGLIRQIAVDCFSEGK
ncbi:hypothetical protein J1N35_025486 [Gossypium stocksii]|uniref:Uncharacterized protein n=1 Tax=Gossypium stocksii TaxID=47602 RepID=A0A9D3ZYB2_9ROSI|nr:hypothetical protein J1N35_025486 [Gossypium stocksii]